MKIECPMCGSTDLRIDVTTTTKLVTDDAGRPSLGPAVEGPFWDDETYVTCVGCGHIDRLMFFYGTAGAAGG